MLVQLLLRLIDVPRCRSRWRASLSHQPPRFNGVHSCASSAFNRGTATSHILRSSYATVTKCSILVATHLALYLVPPHHHTAPWHIRHTTHHQYAATDHTNAKTESKPVCAYFYHVTSLHNTPSHRVCSVSHTTLPCHVSAAHKRTHVQRGVCYTSRAIADYVLRHVVSSNRTDDVKQVRTW